MLGRCAAGEGEHPGHGFGECSVTCLRPVTCLRSGTLNDTWFYRYRGTTAEEACLGIDSDGDAIAGCADPDCFGYCSPQCGPGMTCDLGWPRCGDGECTGVETCRLCPADCGDCPLVCGDFFCDGGEDAISCPGDCGRCGDGTRQGSEECDDGNPDPGDGCNASCKLECGDGVLDPGEACDDGNHVEGDGCTNQCRAEIVFAYTGGLQTWVVPPGLTRVRITMWGAGGAPCWGQSGGGGYSEGELDVTPGETLSILVGGPGQDPAGVAGGAGGFGGGGDGGTGYSPTLDLGGCGGGGRSEVVALAGALTAGGGGGGPGGGLTGTSAAGGGPSGQTPSQTSACYGNFTGGGGGHGGSNGEGGAGGIGCANGSMGLGSGQAGGASVGGNGGSDTLASRGRGGGGGGGGYGGVGGGGASESWSGGAGGGGGGRTTPGGVTLTGSGSIPAAASNPFRGAAGDVGQPGRVVLRSIP